MVFDYFSWVRAKKNTEELEKTNPKTPVLNDDDEKFLHRVATESAAPPLPPMVMSDDGKETGLTDEEVKAAEQAGTVALPASPATEEVPVPAAEGEQTGGESTGGFAEKVLEGVEEGKEKDEQKEGATKEEAADIVPEQVEEKSEAKEGVEAETSESGTEGKVEDNGATQEDSQTDPPEHTEGKETDKAPETKRTWISYVPAVPSMPSMPSMPSVSLPAWGSKGKESAESTNKDGKQLDEGISIKENVKLDHDDDEKEVSVLLDKLNLSSINNRVFSFSKQSQKIYEDFTIVLKDIINGGPTAYKDLEKLLKENEGHLSEMFGNMPPFVQTLVKSLPMKLGSTLGPEVFAATGNKPGNDLRAKMEAASRSPTDKKKKRGSVPDVKGLVSEQGAVSGMLKSIVSFLKTRFPMFMTGTNVIMSLAVFILLFVFWYCHKRGKETRLAKAAGESDVSDLEDEDLEKADEEDVEVEPEEEADEDGAEEEGAIGEGVVENDNDAEATSKSAAAAREVLNQPDPSSVPLPAKDEDKVEYS